MIARKILWRTMVFAVPLFSAPVLFAQDDPATDEEDEIVILSPFEVESDQQLGYMATSTLAGTRIRTDLADVGSAISVVTPEFMQDVGATDNATLLQYTTNAEVAGTRGTYAGLGNGTSVDETDALRAPGGGQRVRGLASADNTRDYFITDIPWDGYNVGRIDIQRGPNAILFGLGSPAGIVNATLDSAEFYNSGEVSLRFGSYGSYRGSADFNIEVIDNVLAVRVEGLWDHEKFKQDPAYEDDERIYFAARYDPQIFSREDFHTSIRVKYENGNIDANRPRIVPPQDSLTPWFRPMDTTSLEGGAGKVAVPNGYAVGSALSAYNPWLAGQVNQQQPLWFIDGTTSELQRIYGGYVNTGAINPANGNPQGSSTNINGQRYSDVFPIMTSLSTYAGNARLPAFQYGQYRNASLTDPSVFDFYNNLIDGPNKNEWEDWNAYNIELSQTAFGDRLGVQFSYDKQEYERGGQGLLGNPTLNIDLLQNFQDYVVGPANANNPNVANPNFGRPFVAGGPGRGSSYESDREYIRASVYAELRTTDLFDEGLLTKILGRHRFNGVYSAEDYFTENREWQMTANSLAYASYKLQGSPDALTNLPPTAVIYLGPSLANASSAANANLSRIQNSVTLEDGNIYQFASTWAPPPGVVYSDPWPVPANLQGIFNGAPVINQATGLPYDLLTQASNPANYVGWNSDFRNELLRYNNGENLDLLTKAAKAMRETTSYAASWQAFLWDDAIVTTLGWRYDEVEGAAVTAMPVAARRNALNLGNVADGAALPYLLPGSDADLNRNQNTSIYKDHSTAAGVVLHLNKFTGSRDFLPLNVSLSYNESNNFQVTDARRGIYGDNIANPAGETTDWGILLSTKDGRYTFRAIKYESNYSGATTPFSLTNSAGNAGITPLIRDALNWRNIKVYYMSGYTWNTAGQAQDANYTGKRYQWDPVYVDNTTGRPVASGNSATGPAGSHLETQAEANIRRDAAIDAINDFQLWLEEKGYFTAWNFGAGPTTPSALQNRGEYEANPVLPDPASVIDYRGSPALQGFAVTSDTHSEGYEFEFTANPTRNWRIAFNAAKTEAVRTNVGGQQLEEIVAYIDELVAGPAGDLVRFNSDYSAGNELRMAYAPWRGEYTLLKLQEEASASELRKWRYNIVTNYSFTEGALEGLGIGGSYRWQDKVVIGYPVIPDGALASFDLSKPYYGPTEDAIDLWVSYERMITDSVKWKIQLNVRNAFADEGLIPVSVQPDGETWATVRVKPVQEWFITNTFSF